MMHKIRLKIVMSQIQSNMGNVDVPTSQKVYLTQRLSILQGSTVKWVFFVLSVFDRIFNAIKAFFP